MVKTPGERMGTVPAADALLELYFDGDRIGAAAEGMPGATLSHEQMMRRQLEYPRGTDESDCVRLFVDFVSRWQWAGDYEGVAVEWARYIAHRHACTSYGRTWRDHFVTVKALEKSGCLGFARLLALSRDRNSCGNGCLALAYPAWRYARQAGADPYRLAWTVTEVSHAHPVAQRCVSALVRYFDSGNRAVFTPDCLPPAGEGAVFTPLAPGCLWAALECSGEGTKESAIIKAAEIGGDVDSFLSLGLLLWGFQKQTDDAERCRQGQP